MTKDSTTNLRKLRFSMYRSHAIPTLRYQRFSCPPMQSWPHSHHTSTIMGAPTSYLFRRRGLKASSVSGCGHLRPGTPITLLNTKRPLTTNAVRLPITPPPNLVAVDSRLFSILARIEQILPIVEEIPCRPKRKPRSPDTRWGGPMRDAETYRLRLPGDNIHRLPTGGC